MPIDYKKYPPNWTREIVPRIKKRAKNCCEVCGIMNYAIGYRDAEKKFVECAKAFPTFSMSKEAKDTLQKDSEYKLIVIVLTIAHLDHDEENWEVEDKRLKTMCQRCHIVYDIAEKKNRVKRKKR